VAITLTPLARVNALRNNDPLQKIEVGYGSLCDRVMERTSFRAGVALVEVQRLFSAHCYDS